MSCSSFLCNVTATTSVLAMEALLHGAIIQGVIKSWKMSVPHLPEHLANTEPWIIVLHYKEYYYEIHVK